MAVCGIAGPGTAHRFNGLMDALKERAPVIAMAVDVETSIMDTEALEEHNPYRAFDVAALYVGRIVDPEQARLVDSDSSLACASSRRRRQPACS